MRNTECGPVFASWFRIPHCCRGWVAEWLKAHAWKACGRATVSRVRISPHPYASLEGHRLERRCFLLLPDAFGALIDSVWVALAGGHCQYLGVASGRPELCLGVI